MNVMVAVQQCFLVQSSDAGVHDLADDLMAHLVTLSETPGSQVLDSAVDANSRENTVTIEVTVEAGNLGDGVNVATNAMRTAIHTIGGNTRRWFTADELQELVDSVGREMRVGTLESLSG